MSRAPAGRLVYLIEKSIREGQRQIVDAEKTQGEPDENDADGDVDPRVGRKTCETRRANENSEPEPERRKGDDDSRAEEKCVSQRVRWMLTLLVEVRDGDRNHREHARREQRQRAGYRGKPEKRAAHVEPRSGVTVSVVVRAGRHSLSLHACERILTSMGGGTSAVDAASLSGTLNTCSPEYVSVSIPKFGSDAFTGGGPVISPAITYGGATFTDIGVGPPLSWVSE